MWGVVANSTLVEPACRLFSKTRAARAEPRVYGFRRPLLSAGIALVALFVVMGQPLLALDNVCNSDLQITFPNFDNVNAIAFQRLVVSVAIENSNPEGGLSQDFDFIDFFPSCALTGVNGVDCTVDPGIDPGLAPPLTVLPPDGTVLDSTAGDFENCPAVGRPSSTYRDSPSRA